MERDEDRRGKDKGERGVAQPRADGLRGHAAEQQFLGRCLKWNENESEREDRQSCAVHHDRHIVEEDIGQGVGETDCQ